MEFRQDTSGFGIQKTHENPKFPPGVMKRSNMQWESLYINAGVDDVLIERKQNIYNG